MLALYKHRTDKKSGLDEKDESEERKERKGARIAAKGGDDKGIKRTGEDAKEDRASTGRREREIRRRGEGDDESRRRAEERMAPKEETLSEFEIKRPISPRGRILDRKSVV